MRGQGLRSKLVVFLFLTLAASRLWAQGPPYQTDDPVPVDLHHYEFYIFGTTDGTPVETDSTGPAFEFNWGAIPRVQLHAILPWGSMGFTGRRAGLRGLGRQAAAPRVGVAVCGSRDRWTHVSLGKHVECRGGSPC